MMLLTARKRAFGPKRLAAGQVCRLSDLWRHAQPATLVDFRGSSLSDAGSIPAISTLNRRPKFSKTSEVYDCRGDPACLPFRYLHLFYSLVLKQFNLADRQACLYFHS